MTPNNWKPKEGQKYYFITGQVNYFNVQSDIYEEGDEFSWEDNIVKYPFPTRKLAEKKLKLILEVLRK